MQEEDWNEFVNLFSEVCHAFSTEKSSATRAVYWQYLKPFSIEDIGEAIKNLIITRVYWQYLKPFQLKISVKLSKISLLRVNYFQLSVPY